MTLIRDGQEVSARVYSFASGGEAASEYDTFNGPEKTGRVKIQRNAGGDRTQTIAALPTIIGALHKRGYRLVTVPQLLHDDPPPAGQPLPTNLSGG